MTMDRYSKVIFTVIALALATLAVGQFMPGSAVAQGAGCGSSPNSPCYVEAASNGGLSVDTDLERYFRDLERDIRDLESYFRDCNISAEDGVVAYGLCVIQLN